MSPGPGVAGPRPGDGASPKFGAEPALRLGRGGHLVADLRHCRFPFTPGGLTIHAPSEDMSRETGQEYSPENYPVSVLGSGPRYPPPRSSFGLDPDGDVTPGTRVSRVSREEAGR